VESYRCARVTAGYTKPFAEVFNALYKKPFKEPFRVQGPEPCTEPFAERCNKVSAQIAAQISAKIVAHGGLSQLMAGAVVVFSWE
jgi:hypothetical protein